LRASLVNKPRILMVNSRVLWMISNSNLLNPTGYSNCTFSWYSSV